MQAYHRGVVLLSALTVANVAHAAVTLERVVQGSSSGLVYAASPVANNLFLIEQSGNIKLYNTQTKTSTNFLNLSGGNFVGGGELGLLGIAFDPNFDTNGYFYVNSTRRSATKYNNNVYNEITRYKRSDTNPNAVDSTYTPQTIIEIPKTSTAENHNAGWLGFGKDGMLYITTGDGGSTPASAQSGDSLLGKVLRLDVSNPTISYAIPQDNPFANGNGGANAAFRDEIWALGLRNPFRASIDSKTGDLYIGDVGQSSWEEIDRQAAGVGGVNFGWNFKEGNAVYQGTPPAGLTDPLYAYGRGDGRSVIGGTVFRGGTDLDGSYLFSDFFGNGTIWMLPAQCVAAGLNCPAESAAQALAYSTTAGTLGMITGFSEDAAGNLYISDYDGDVFRLNAAPVPVPAAAWLLGSALLGMTRYARRHRPS